MTKNFSDFFLVIFQKFSDEAQKSGIKPNTATFARFLGHKHDGRVRAWRNGQWPSAEDVWILHDKLGFAYAWLLIGEGEPFDRDVSIKLSETSEEGARNAMAMASRIEELETIILHKTEELARARQEHMELMKEMLSLQSRHVALLEERAGSKKQKTDPADGSDAFLREDPAGYGNPTFHEPQKPYGDGGRKRKPR